MACWPCRPCWPCWPCWPRLWRRTYTTMNSVRHETNQREIRIPCHASRVPDQQRRVDRRRSPPWSPRSTSRSTSSGLLRPSRRGLALSCSFLAMGRILLKPSPECFCFVDSRACPGLILRFKQYSGTGTTGCTLDSISSFSSIDRVFSPVWAMLRPQAARCSSKTPQIWS